MWILYTMWFVLPGAVAVLAGLSGMRRRRRLRRSGLTAWAMIVTVPGETAAPGVAPSDPVSTDTVSSNAVPSEMVPSSTASPNAVPLNTGPSNAGRSTTGEPGRLAGRRLAVQFELPDGRIIERPFAAAGRRSAAYRPGGKVLIWYDPDDPGDVLVYGRGGRRADRVFLAVGLLFVALGAVMVALVR
jgi:Protein of unknown function (DUF3592)